MAKKKTKSPGPRIVASRGERETQADRFASAHTGREAYLMALGFRAGWTAHEDRATAREVKPSADIEAAAWLLACDAIAEAKGVECETITRASRLGLAHELEKAIRWERGRCMEVVRSERGKYSGEHLPPKVIRRAFDCLLDAINPPAKVKPAAWTKQPVWIAGPKPAKESAGGYAGAADAIKRYRDARPQIVRPVKPAKAKGHLTAADRRAMFSQPGDAAKAKGRGRGKNAK